MKEKLIDIVSNIDSCVKQGTGISPFARVHCLFDGVQDTYWFCDRYYSSHDLNELKRFGHFVPKNSRVAIKMQTYEVGSSFEYDQINNIRKMQTHRVVLENRSDFQNQSIAIAGDSILYQFRNISEFLVALRNNREEIEDVEKRIAELKREKARLSKSKNSAYEKGKITKAINENETVYRILTLQQEDLKNITIYIRKQGEMRYSLIVDPIQTRIKSQNIFDGKTVIINGGPGTGKSTTMIHRLSYLTDTFAIEEDLSNNPQNYKLNTTQRKQLLKAINDQRDWMFFSPSQMLKEYLADAMRKEGLKNTSEKVWNWKDYCRSVLRANYGLLGSSDTKSPFKVCFLEGTLFFQNSEIIKELNGFYLNQLREIKNKFPQLNTDGKVFLWTSIAQNIARRFEGCESFDISRFVSLFNTLESVYANDCKNLLHDKDIAINGLTKEIYDLLDKDKDAKSNFIDFADLVLDSEDSIEDEDSTEIEETNTAEGGKKAQADKLFSKIQNWLKSYCQSIADDTYQISEEHQLINEVLLPLLGDKYDNQFRKVGELIIFEQFAKYTKGTTSIMFRNIPDLYKKFRSHLIKTRFEGCDLKLLRDIMQRKQGRELHHQEQSLLLGFINNLVKEVKNSNSLSNRHKYIVAYDEVSRPIIGIDEATDFSACDIYAMQSLLTQDFNSLTLCGDMMQRLTTYGIKSWSELNGIVSNPTIVEMKTSYRQSKKLLEVARKMYVDTLSESPSYKAFMKSERVPDPLVFINDNETSKIDWISKRISEVYRAYGDQLPSIAIFVNDKGYIPRFIENLERTGFFSKVGIKVLDGTSKNTKTTENHICVYPIEVVKGMEFDVVFFHNIDNASVDTEILKRYIYVGVSRAAFFLGITLSEKKPEISKYFVQNKDWFKI